MRVLASQPPELARARPWVQHAQGWSTYNFRNVQIMAPLDGSVSNWSVALAGSKFDYLRCRAGPSVQLPDLGAHLRLQLEQVLILRHA